MPTTTKTETLNNGTKVYTAQNAAFGSDALLLARFAQPRADAAALDLCSGCGIVSLMWHDAGHRGRCDGVEIDSAASALLERAAAENKATHIHAVCTDLRTFCQSGPERGRYAFAACNPPYFTAGPQSPDARRAAARHEGLCSFADVAACAARCLRDGGKLVLCHKPGQLPALFNTLCQNKLEPKRAAFVKNRPDAAPWLVLVEAQKNRRPGIIWQPDLLLSAGAAAYGPGSACQTR